MTSASLPIWLLLPHLAAAQRQPAGPAGLLRLAPLRCGGPPAAAHSLRLLRRLLLVFVLMVALSVPHTGAAIGAATELAAAVSTAEGAALGDADISASSASTSNTNRGGVSSVMTVAAVETAVALQLLRGGIRGDGRGGVSRALQQALQAPAVRPAAASFETHPRNAPIITVALTQVPSVGQRSRKYFAYWRVWNDTMTRSAATFDLDSGTVRLLNTRYDQFCNGPIVMPDGHTVIFGGYNIATKTQADGRRAISVYNEAKQRIINIGKMTFSRWYPTPCLTADKKVLIVGGTAFPDKGPTIPVAELWDPAKARATPVAIPLPPAFNASCWLNWYPFIALLPRGEMLWWGDRGGSITNSSWNEIYKFPALPGSFPYRTMYWFTSSIVLNALKPDPRTGEYNAFSMTIFGGAPTNATGATPASPVSARLDMFYCGPGICDRGWVIEDMAGQRRVMPTTTVLPNGKVYIHGGGQAGVAGWKKGSNGYQATLPAYQDLVYDPDAPQGNRYSLSGTLGIIRMYHSASCLDLSGKVMSSGCETCGMTGVKAGPLPVNVSRSPDGDLDYRISFAVPYEISKAVTRPVIVTAPTVVKRGSNFTVTYNYTGTVKGATLAAPCANTHSINMNQRVLFLTMASAAGGVATIRAPPISQPAAVHAGYYQLFLLGANTATGRTYSEGVWIRLTDS